jgi:hypothetical protein
MRFGRKKKEAKGAVSATTLALGAAGLFLFIVGVRRSLPKVDDPPATPQDGPHKVHGDMLEELVPAGDTRPHEVQG